MSDLPVVCELAQVPSIEQVLVAFQQWRNPILFDSALCRSGVGRYSYFSADPRRFCEWQQVTAGADPFDVFRQWLSSEPTPVHPELPPFQGGVAGLLAYEAGHAWEQLPQPKLDQFRIPHVAAGLYDWVLAWDHQTAQCWLISQGLPGGDRSRRRRMAQQRLAQVQSRLAAVAQKDTAETVAAIVPGGLDPQPRFPVPNVPGVTSNFSREGYLEAVQRVVEFIRAGDIFQANLSQRLLAPAARSALATYLCLRETNPAPFAGFFQHDDWAVISASPERFLTVSAEGYVQTRPIKGTRRRKQNPQADLYTRDELRQSEKDQAENVMIVDLLRNDLSRVCQPGTVCVPSLCEVETYETVQHLVSVIEGRLQPGRDAWDLLAAAFPGGSITGAPKVRAMEIITELEQTARGAYCGSLFHVGFDGMLDSNILIRTLTWRGGWIQCPVGGGIVVQSDPVSEYDETLHKAAGMLPALGSAARGRTPVRTDTADSSATAGHD